ncbi:MAG TPA: hypothetical protein VF783_14210 [Terriglobales bacterium]
MGQKYAAYNSSGGVVAFYDSIDSPVPNGVNAIAISDAQWQTCISTSGYTVQNGVLTAPSAAVIAAQQTAAAWAAYQRQAQAALAESDLTILRCYESAVAVPAAWATYRKALRSVLAEVTGDPTQPLPTKPAYPSGT